MPSHNYLANPEVTPEANERAKVQKYTGLPNVRNPDSSQELKKWIALQVTHLLQ
jgi:hypothetical protein